MDKYYFDLALKELRAAMDNDSDEKKFSDLIYSLEQIRANPHIPAEALSALEAAHEKFLRHVREEPEIALQAYAYGSAIGAYFVGLDPKVLTETDRLLRKMHQARRGKRSGQIRRDNRGWTEHAKDLALQARTKDPSLSQEKVASEIEFCWKLDDKCPGHSTLKTFVSDLEKAGELAKRSRKGRS